jgi:hypothetical protein
MNAGWRALAEVLADWIEPVPAVPAVYLFGFPIHLFGFPKRVRKKKPRVNAGLSLSYSR